MAPTSEWLFVPGLPRRSLEIVPVWTLGALHNHNSLLRPLIEMRSKANLYLSSRAFQRCVALDLHAPGSSRFPTFSSRESNWALLFAITCAADVQMVHARPFSTSALQ